MVKRYKPLSTITRPEVYSMPTLREAQASCHLDGETRCIEPVPTKEIGVLLRGPLVRQFLAGRKTVTRRTDLKKWRKAKPGDLIWFRETSAEFEGERIYAADADLVRDDSGERVGWWLGDRFIPGKERPFKWTPSLLMPKREARCWAVIEDIREERLHKITEGDAIAEGATMREFINPLTGRKATGWALDWSRVGKMSKFATGSGTGKARGLAPLTEFDVHLVSARWAFANIWTAINGSKSGLSWHDNPIVARIQFRRIEQSRLSADFSPKP